MMLTSKLISLLVFFEIGLNNHLKNIPEFWIKWSFRIHQSIKSSYERLFRKATYHASLYPMTPSKQPSNYVLQLIFVNFQLNVKQKWMDLVTPNMTRCLSNIIIDHNDFTKILQNCNYQNTYLLLFDYLSVMGCLLDLLSSWLMRWIWLVSW